MRETEGKQLTMPFGKHKGETLDHVPAEYLLWLRDQEWAYKFGDIMDYIEEGLECLENEVDEQSILAPGD